MIMNTEEFSRIITGNPSVLLINVCYVYVQRQVLANVDVDKIRCIVGGHFRFLAHSISAIVIFFYHLYNIVFLLAGMLIWTPPNGLFFSGIEICPAILLGLENTDG